MTLSTALFSGPSVVVITLLAGLVAALWCHRLARRDGLGATATAVVVAGAFSGTSYLVLTFAEKLGILG
jgi:hypothetical protein